MVIYSNLLFRNSDPIRSSIGDDGDQFFFAKQIYAVKIFIEIKVMLTLYVHPVFSSYEQ